MKTSKLFYVLLSLLVVAMMLSACGGAPAAEEPAFQGLHQEITTTFLGLLE